MEIDVSISALEDGVSLNFKNFVHLSLSDTDSSNNSLMSVTESDSNDSTVAGILTEDACLKISNCEMSTEIEEYSNRINDSLKFNSLVSNSKSVCKEQSLSIEDGTNVCFSRNVQVSDPLEAIKLSSSKYVCVEGKRRYSYDSIATLISKNSENKFKGSQLKSNSCLNLFCELNVRNDQSCGNPLSSLSANSCGNLELDQSFHRKNNSEFVIKKNINHSLSLNCSYDESKSFSLENHVLDGNVLITKSKSTEIVNAPSTTVCSIFCNKKNLSENSNETGVTEISKPVKTTMRGPKNEDGDISDKKMIHKASTKINKGRNALHRPISEKNHGKSVLNSHLNHLSLHYFKCKKEVIPLPNSQNIVLCTKENELQVASIQSLTQNRIVIETSNLLESHSAKKKVRQVFPTKITKSKLSNIMDDLDISLGNPSTDKSNKKIKEINFGTVGLPTTNSVSELKGQSKLLDNSNSCGNFEDKRKPHSLVLPTNDGNGSYLSQNKTKYADGNVGQKSVMWPFSSAHAKTFLEKDVVKNNPDTLLNISNTPESTDVNKKTIFSKHNIRNANEQMPIICEGSCNKIEHEVVNISNSVDLSKTFELDGCKTKLKMANNNIALYPDANHSEGNIKLSPEIIYDNAEICDDSFRNKVCSAPCTQIVGRISPIKRKEIICGTAKSAGFRIKSPEKCINVLEDLDYKVVSKVANILPNFSKDNVEPPLKFSQEILKEKLGLVAKRKKSPLTNNHLKKWKANSNVPKECVDLYDLVPPNILPANSSQALQKLIDLFELVILSKDHLGFVYKVIETLSSETKKCKESNSIIIFDILAQKSTLSTFKMCKFILDNARQSLLPGPKMDNVALSLKAVESILCIANRNSKLNVKFVADATMRMSEVKIFLFTRTIFECKSLPIPKFKDLQPFLDKVKHYAATFGGPENICNVNEVPELFTSLQNTVAPQECDNSYKKDKVTIKQKVFVCNSFAKHTVNNKNIIKDVMNGQKYDKPPVIKKSLNSADIDKKLLLKTHLNTTPVCSTQNIKRFSICNDFSNCFENLERTCDSAPVSATPSFTRDQVEKMVENFLCFDENIQSAIKGYLQELSQTSENADYACRLLNTVKKLS